MRSLNRAEIVPQRTRSDCAVAALATLQGWTYEKAREVLGTRATEAGTYLQPLAIPLLAEGIAATHLISQDHPEVTPALAEALRKTHLATPAEMRRALLGRRAIVTGICLHDNGERAEGRGHAIAWDGERAIECGSVAEGCAYPATELDINAVPLWEALILTDAPGGKPEEAVEAPLLEAGSDSAADVAERHERVFLAFSGGKESVVLAHMLEPWRDRVTLLWVNTGFMAPHMVEFVRGYHDRGWGLEELASPNLAEHWQAVGTPAEVFPLANIHGSAVPRLQPWTHCCNALRQEPMNAFLRAQPGPCGFVNGQRRQDQNGATIAGLSSQLPPTVEIAMPLATWSEADVFAYIARHGLTLPAQYAEGYHDSIECLPCPAPMKAERLRWLRRHHPDMAAIATEAASAAVQTTGGALVHIVGTVSSQ